MTRFLLWCLLFVVCWPIALAALVLYPVLWLIVLPFRLLGASLSAIFDLVTGLILLPVRLPARLLRAA